MLPFWISILALSLAQGATVALPGVLTLPFADRLRSRWWAAIPAGTVIAFVFGVRAAEESAQGLTYLALVAVPLLALLALGGLAYGGRPLLALLVAPLFALAWADTNGLPGEAAAVILTALSCVALGVLITTVTPRSWLAAGIIVMAMVDTALVVSDLLQSPNEALNAARPVADLPQLQAATFGSAVMGYGDLFVAGALGALLATYGRACQLRGALLGMFLASLFDLLFFAVSELPATVPMALTLIVMLLARRIRSGRTSASAGPGELELKPQIYRDERPSTAIDPLYDWALEHDPGLIFDMTRMVFMPFCMLFFRLRCIDSACVPSSGPAIIAPNHFSVMDHFFCGVYLRRRVRFMAKSQLFRGPLRILLPRLGAFPVQRGKQDERAIETALEILRRGGVIVIYPEGGRSRSGFVGRRARPGVGRLALESGAPVVPVAIGSQRARNWRRLEFPQVMVRYGEPLCFPVRTSPGPAERHAVADAILARVRELHERLGQQTGARGEPAVGVPPAG